MAITLDIYAPFDSGPGASTTEGGWRRIMRRLAVPGVIRDVDNAMEVYADSTGMQVKVKTGEVWAEGHWGTISSEKTVAIAAAHATLARVDRIVWRADYVNNRIEVDAVTGTPAASPSPPTLTRNTSIFEGSLAVVSVPAADTGIDASQVTDARIYGGPTLPTLADDYTLFGDKLSSCQRNSITTASASNNGFAYASVFGAQRDSMISKLRVYIGTAQVAGTVAVKIYAGYHRRDLQDVTGAASVAINTIGSPNSIHEGTVPSPIPIQAGMFVAVAYLALAASTAATIGCGSVVIDTEILNVGTISSDPATRWTTVFKSGQTVLPSKLDVYDGTWSRRDRIPWVGLA